MRTHEGHSARATTVHVRVRLPVPIRARMGLQGYVFTLPDYRGALAHESAHMHSYTHAYVYTQTNTRAQTHTPHTHARTPELAVSTVTTLSTFSTKQLIRG